MLWRCPRCRGELIEVKDGVRCRSCDSVYDSVGGILDLRLPGMTWIDYDADKADARRLLAETAGLTIEELVRRVFSSRRDWSQARVELRTQQVTGAPERLRKDIRGWLHSCTSDSGIFLDLGCGPGMLLAAAAAEGRKGVGIDVSMVWLVVARRLILQWGEDPDLAAANAESLPLADGSVGGVVSLDVIEHVADPAAYLSEINRVIVPGGTIALSTPNRYSLAAEPHVSVWGVGWLPYSLQKKYVKWRSGAEYEFTRLLSARKLGQLLQRHTSIRYNIQVPLVPDEEIVHFMAYRAILARLYNRLALLSSLRGMLRTIGPFFRIVGEKT
jgi:2-polyprenyl-3-methyl-5-hydroxy-6-metoxy-1,4-benzoquinol methylase